MGLVRSVTTVGGYTMLSRILGFVRDALTAAALGAGPVSDAFVVAQRLPNLFRSLFAEGAFSAAFVPIFARMIAEEGEDAARRFAERVMSVLLVALLATLVVSEMFMPLVIPFIAAGFTAAPGELALASELTRITFPYLVFISLVSLLGGILNSVNRFAAVAFTPVLLNLFMIGAIFGARALGYVGTEQISRWLCWGIMLSGMTQFLWLMISAARAGMKLHLHWPSLGADVWRFLGLMLPGVFGAGVTQINLLVSTNIASLLPHGSITYLYYADRLNQLPLAVVGIAVGTAILPPLARQLREADGAAANATQNRGIELAFLLTLPAAAALAVLAEPILIVLFRRGHFDAHAAHETARALMVYACGLPAFVGIKVLAPAFYARHDTRTPVKIGIAAVAVNLVLVLALSGPFAHVGNATATTAAGWVNAGLLAFFLHRRGHFTIDAQLRRRLPRIFAASLGMMAVLFVAERHLHGVIYQGMELSRLIALAALIGLGLASYFALATVFKAAGAGELANILRRRRAA